MTNKNARSLRFLDSFFTSPNLGAFNRCMEFSETYVPIISYVFDTINDN